jgi:hypothetical protein
MGTYFATPTNCSNRGDNKRSVITIDAHCCDADEKTNAHELGLVIDRNEKAEWCGTELVAPNAKAQKGFE